MTGSESKVAAECTSCGAIYAANRQADGTLRPIGREGCRCGSDEFRAVEREFDANDPVGTGESS